MFQGHVDVVQQSHCTGWAARDGLPATVRIIVNGREVSCVRPNISRLDLVAHWLPEMAGFSLHVLGGAGRHGHPRTAV